MSTISPNPIPGHATMPSPRSAEAPYFSGRRDDSIADFLFEYDTLTTGCGLSDSQKVTIIVLYIARSERNLWRIINGYSTGDWKTFKATLESLYPDTSAATRYTRRTLQDFANISAKIRIRDEDDVMTYYRRFITLSNPLFKEQRITDEDRNVEFFLGFHPDHRGPLESRVFAMKPDHPIGEPYALEDVLTAARRHFSRVQRRHSQPHEFRDDPIDLREEHPAKLDAWMRRVFGREDRDPSGHRPGQVNGSMMDDRDSWSDYQSQREPNSPRDRDLQDKPDYYETTTDHFSDHGPVSEVRRPRAQSRHHPGTGETDASTIPTEYQVPSSQLGSRSAMAISTHQPQTQSTASPITLSDDALAYFYPLRTKGCIFCADLGHHVRRCATAEDYTRTGRTLILNDRLYLPNGRPIPNDGKGRGLKPAIDKWLAANTFLQLTL